MLIVDSDDMTILTETEPGVPPDRTELIAALRVDAEYYRPRMFAIYGVSNGIYSLPERPFLGWGLDFGDDDGAIFWDQEGRSTYQSCSAQRVLELRRRIGEAHLRWLD